MAPKSVVVGCATYESSLIASLRFPERDAEELHRRLIDPAVGGYAVDDVQLLHSPAHAEAARAVARCFRVADRDDVVLFYFAGHGLRGEDGELYLALRDSDPDLLEVSAISGRQLREMIGRCRSRQICVLLDCCFSGALTTRRVLSATDVTQAVESLADQGTVIIAAAQRSQDARERADLGHGVFTSYVLRGIDGPADTNADGIITPLDLYNYVASEMERDVGPTQRPTLSAKVAGGAFPLVRSAVRRQRAVGDLTAKVKQLCDEKRHDEALALVDGFPSSVAGGSNDLQALRDSVTTDKRRLLEDFRRAILASAARADLSDRTLHSVLERLSAEPDTLFDVRSTGALDRLLRHHFIGRVDAHALEDMWSQMCDARAPKIEAKEPEHTPAPVDPVPVKTSSVSQAGVPPSGQASRWRPRLWPVAVWGTTAILAAGLVLFGNRSDPTGPPHLRIGLLLKREWPPAEAEKAFSAMTVELSSRLRGIAAVDSKVVSFVKIGEIAEALKEKRIDIAGELSPRDIYEVEGLGADPFVTAKYDGVDYYRSMVFLPSSSPYLVAGENLPVKAQSWRNLLEALKTKDGRLAVSDESSTSGYWFPRSLLLAAFRDRRWNLSFGEVVVPLPAQDLFQSVACGYQKVVAGVIAEFRLAKQPVMCRDQPVTLVTVQQSAPILNGGFVIRRELIERHGDLVPRLRDSWNDAILSVPQDLRDLLKFPTAWSEVNMGYYEPTRQIFRERDFIQEKHERDQKVALSAAAVILVISVLGYYYFAGKRASRRVGTAL